MGTQTLLSISAKTSQCLTTTKTSAKYSAKLGSGVMQTLCTTDYSTAMTRDALMQVVKTGTTTISKTTTRTNGTNAQSAGVPENCPTIMAGTAKQASHSKKSSMHTKNNRLSEGTTATPQVTVSYNVKPGSGLTTSHLTIQHQT